jgi:uncharacterized phiE125 gp8 family phage protein
MYALQRLPYQWFESSSSSGDETAPLAVSLAEAKKQVEVASAITYHDDHLTRLIKAATQQATERSGRQLLTSGYRLTIDAFPRGSGNIPLPFPPLRSVESVKYYDEDGDQQALSTDVYRVLDAREPAEICLKHDQSWPSTYDEPDVVTIEYLAGVADTAAELGPEDEWYRQAILLLVQAYWLRDHDQVYDRLLKAADSILEAHRCGDDFVPYGDT